MADRLNASRLTKKQIGAWDVLHHQDTGQWLRVRSGPIMDAPGESWAVIEATFDQRAPRRFIVGQAPRKASPSAHRADLPPLNRQHDPEAGRFAPPEGRKVAKCRVRTDARCARGNMDGADGLGGRSERVAGW